MTDEEYEIIDELYFIISFAELLKKINIEEHSLKNILLKLIQKGWVRCIDEHKETDVEDLSMFEKKYSSYHYLASKQGLMEHNMR